MLSRIVLVFVVAVLGVEKARGEEPPELVTDRPDQTESSVVVLPGFVQIEVGTTYTGQGEDGQRTRILEAPGTLFRIGLVDRIELRLGTTGWSRQGGGSEGGFGDSELGAKIYFWEEAGGRPETALLTAVSLPTGSDGLSTKRVDPSFRFAFSHTLSERVSFGYNLGAYWETEVLGDSPQDRLSFFLYTVTAGIGLTDRLGTFVELYGDAPMNGDGGAAHSLDGGFVFLVHKNFQLDVHVGKGLSEVADEWSIGGGISVRLPR